MQQLRLNPAESTRQGGACTSDSLGSAPTSAQTPSSALPDLLHPQYCDGVFCTPHATQYPTRASQKTLPPKPKRSPKRHAKGLSLPSLVLRRKKKKIYKTEYFGRRRERSAGPTAAQAGRGPFKSWRCPFKSESACAKRAAATFKLLHSLPAAAAGGSGGLGGTGKEGGAGAGGKQSGPARPSQPGTAWGCGPARAMVSWILSRVIV